MERDAINEFVDNLIQEKDISSDDAIELKEILEISAKDIENKNLSIFLKTVRDSINAPSNNFFSRHGVDFYSIKNIAEKIASEVKKEQKVKNEKLNSQNEEIENKFIQRNNEDILNYKKIEEVTSWFTTRYPNMGIVTAIDMAKRIPKVKKIMEDYEDAKQSGDVEKMLQIQESVDGLNKIAAIELFEMEAEQRAKEEGIPEEDAILVGISTNSFISDELNRNIEQSDGNIYYSIDDYEDVYCDNVLNTTPQFTDTQLDDSFDLKRGTENDNGKISENQQLQIKENKRKINITGWSLSKILSLHKYNIANQSREKILGELEKIEQALEEGLDITWDADGTNLPQIMGEFIEAKRKERELRLIMLKEREVGELDVTYDANIEKENTLLNDKEKRKLIIDLYYKQSLSAVEIYEQLKERHIIEKDSYLIPEDVIEVVASEASKHCSPSEIKEMIEREREIEKIRAREKIYERIYENARTRRKIHEMEDCDRRIEGNKINRKSLNDEGFEFRKKVSRYQAIQMENNTNDIQITDIQADGFQLKKGSEYFQEEPNRKFGIKQISAFITKKIHEMKLGTTDIANGQREIKDTIVNNTKETTNLENQQSQDEH